MATKFTNDTSTTVYHDDFSDSAGYQKILFNSGRALQARELTQLQTILQKQITRFADSLYLDGAAVSSKSAGSGAVKTEYVLLESVTPPGSPAKDYIGVNLKGTGVSGQNTGLVFAVSHAEEISGTEKAILFGSYISAGQDTVSPDIQGVNSAFSRFANGEVLSVVNPKAATTLKPSPAVSALVATVPSGTSPGSTGKGLLFTVQTTTFYSQGHFVYVPKQTLTVSRYNSLADAEVGFEVSQDVVSVLDTDALYDNQGSVPNLSSPGADRYRIRMTLTTKADVVNKLNFVSFSILKSGETAALKAAPDDFNNIEIGLARRTRETNGDFITNPFNIKFGPGSSEQSLTMTVKGKVNGLQSTAFLNGYRLVQPADSDFSIPKPVSFTTEEATSTTISYKNYVNATLDTSSINTGIDNWLTTYNVSTGLKVFLRNAAGGKIGRCRIKSLLKLIPAENSVEIADLKGTRIYLSDISMISGQNLSDVKYMSPLSAPTTGNSTTELAGYIELFLTDSKLLLNEPGNNSSLFPIFGGRLKSLSSVSYDVQRSFSIPSGSATTRTINVGSGETFTETSRWLVINTTGGTVVPTSVALGGDPTSADITVPAGTAAYTVLAMVKKLTPTLGTKTLTQTSAITLTCPDAAVADLVFSTLLYDGVKIVSATTTRADGVVDDLMDDLIFDGGQRDNFYEPITITRSGYNGVTDVIVVLQHFVHSANADYFSVNSYNFSAVAPRFTYGMIPTYLSKKEGISYDLKNHIDFRSVSDTTDTFPADALEIPRDGGQIAYVAEFYNRRIDHIAITYNDTTFKPQIKINRGVENLQPLSPERKVGEMLLFAVSYGGNTINTRDLSVDTFRYKRFTMKDIGSLENRVNRLETTVSLNALEQSAANLVEVDVEGLVRSKTGFFVDNFSNGFQFSANKLGPNWVDNQSQQTLLQLGTSEYAVEPKRAIDSIAMLMDSANQDFIYSRLPNNQQLSNVKRAGDLVYLDYIDVLDDSLVNESISWKSGGVGYNESGYYNVNPFNVFSGRGRLELKPEKDNRTEQVHLPDLNVDADDVVNSRVLTDFVVNGRSTNGSSQMDRALNGEMGEGDLRPIGGSWNGGGRNSTIVDNRWPRTNSGWVYPGRISKNSFKTDATNTVSTTEKTSVFAVPFMRQRPIFGHATALRPNTRYWATFNKVDISIWCRSITETDYYGAVVSGSRHLDDYEPVNTTYQTGHPQKDWSGTGTGGTSLITNARGELWFSFWLPNNAPVPSFSGNEEDPFANWENWIQEQTEAANIYGGPYAVGVMNASGWKFPSGNAKLMLGDTSPLAATGIDETNSLSTAVADFESGLSVTLERITNTTTRTVTDVIIYEPYDPLAQSFYVNGGDTPGVFVTKVDVFIRKTPQIYQTGTTVALPNGTGDMAIPLELEIREMADGGTPRNVPISKQYMSKVDAADAQVIVDRITDKEVLTNAANTGVLDNPVTFTFSEPVYLESNKEYAIVLLADTDNYEAFISTTYDLVLGKTEERVSQQPALGSLFLSQNGNTWTPRQDQDLAYRIYTAKFKNEGTVNFRNADYPKFLHNRKILLSDTSDQLRFRVQQFDHGLGIGDSVGLEGLEATQNYNGLTGNQIMGTGTEQLKVEQADASGYYAKLYDASNNALTRSFTSSGSFGDSACKSNSSFNFDRGLFDVQTRSFGGSSVEYVSSFITGISLSNIDDTATTDNRFLYSGYERKIGSQQIVYFDKPMMLANVQAQNSEIGSTPTAGAASIIVGAKLKTDQTSDFGGALASANSNYVSDVSPIIDLQACTFEMENFQIDNQPLTDVPKTTVQNKPFRYKAETDPLGGTSPSAHITKPITLEEAANGLKIFVEINKPPSAMFDLYYRIASGDESIFNLNWILRDPENSPSDDNYNHLLYDPTRLNYSEYRYLLGGLNGTLPGFTTFQLKIVMKSTNSCEIPVLKSIRAIALI